MGNGNYDNACFDGPVYDMEREILDPNLVGLLAGKRGSGKPGARGAPVYSRVMGMCPGRVRHRSSQALM